MGTVPVGSESSRLVATFELRRLEVPCGSCGRQIEVSVPWSLVENNTLGNHHKSLRATLAPVSGHGDSWLCLRCRIGTDAGAAKRLRGLYEEILESAAQAGIPAAATPILPIYFSADDHGPHKAWHGFRGRMLAVQVVGGPSGLADCSEVNVWHIDANDGRSADLLIYETRIWRERIPASLVFRSRPGQGKPTLEVRNWHQVERLDHLKSLMKGIEVYQAFRNLGGRPPDGSEEVLAAIRAVAATGERPSQARVAILLYPDSPRPQDSLNKRLRRLRGRSGIAWSELKRLAAD